MFVHSCDINARMVTGLLKIHPSCNGMYGQFPLEWYVQPNLDSNA